MRRSSGCHIGDARKTIARKGKVSDRGSARRCLSVLGEDGNLTIWDRDATGFESVFHEDSSYCLTQLDSGRTLYSGSSNGDVIRWDGERRRMVTRNHICRNAVSSILPSPDGRSLAVQSVVGEVRLVDAKTLAPQCGVQPTIGTGDSMAFWNVGRHLAWVNKRGKVYSMPLADGSTRSLEPFPAGSTVALGIAGDRVAVAGAGGKRMLRQFEPRKAVGGLGKIPDDVTHFCLSDDRCRLAAVTDRAVYLWDLTEKRPGGPVRLANHSHRTAKVAFSPDGRNVASVGKEGRILLWDAQQGMLQIVPHQGPSAVHAALFTKDGSQFVASFQTGNVNFWNIRGGKTARETVAN